MALTLRELLAHSSHQNDIKIIAGTLGLNRHCRWIHVVEDDDVPNFLHGNELIFTTGIGISSKPVFSLMKFVETLLSRNCCGWVLNIGPYITEVPRELIEICNVKCMPLLDFSKLTYNEETGAYEAASIDTSYAGTITNISIKFNNNKLVSYECTYKWYGNVTTFTINVSKIGETTVVDPLADLSE